MNVVAYATLTVSSTAVTLASASPAITSRTKHAVITVEDDEVRYRPDGTAPTSTEGVLLSPGGGLEYLTHGNYKSVLNAIQFIRVTGDAKLKIIFYD